MEYLDKMDAFGLLLLTFGWCLMLLPFTLSAGAKGGYNNRELKLRGSKDSANPSRLIASMIAMFVVGGVIFIFFCVWEWKFANYPLQSKHVLNRSFVSRTVICSRHVMLIYLSQICSVVIDFMYYLSGYISDTYFTSWIYVVTDWSVSHHGLASSSCRPNVLNFALQDKNYGYYVNMYVAMTLFVLGKY